MNSTTSGQDHPIVVNCQPHQELAILRNWQHRIPKTKDKDKQAKNKTHNTKMMRNTDLTEMGMNSVAREVKTVPPSYKAPAMLLI